MSNHIRYHYYYYHQYKNTKQVLTAIQKGKECRITHELKLQGFVISCILNHASSKTRSLWSIVQQSMPKNIFNFLIKCLNNTLATRKNLCKWFIFPNITRYAVYTTFKISSESEGYKLTVSGYYGNSGDPLVFIAIPNSQPRIV